MIFSIIKVITSNLLLFWCILMRICRVEYDIFLTAFEAAIADWWLNWCCGALWCTLTTFYWFFFQEPKERSLRRTVVFDVIYRFIYLRVVSMPLLESGLITVLKTISFFFDVFAYIPYYLIQNQGKVKRLANRNKVWMLHPLLLL